MKKSIAIIGGGPAALFVAVFLDSNKFDITIYEKNKSLGRKLLVAGKGGFNLTHSEPINQLIERYTPSDFIKESLYHFSNTDLQNWLNEIGIPTFIGSSQRVYPKKGVKPIEVLNAIISIIKLKKITINYNHTWMGWDDMNYLLFNSDIKIKSSISIFALGGGSWKVTGSDGIWLDTFNNKGIDTTPFQPSNCAYHLDWDTKFISKFEGVPLKNIAITCLDKKQKGEVVITRFGLEGNAIYALSPQIKKELNKKKFATIYLDLKPTLNVDEIIPKLEKSLLKNTTDKLRKELKLTPAQIALLKNHISKKDFLNIDLLAQSIKKLSLEIFDSASLNEAISTTGGIHLNSIDENFQLKKIKDQYCIGEMLDYDAPTGGYLLQSCFSMGVNIANHLNEIN